MGDNSTKIVIEGDGRALLSTLKEVSDGLKVLQRTTKDVADNTSASGKGIVEAWASVTTGVNQGIELVKKSVSAMMGIIDFARDAAAFDEMKRSFSSLAAGVGISSEAMLASTRKASDGMVSNLELIKMNSMALRLGVGQTTGDIDKLWTIAAFKSDQLGMSVAATFEKIASAIGRGKGKELIELGLLPEKFGRSADAAGLMDQRVNLLKETLSQGLDQMAKYGSGVETSADKFDRFDSSITNLTLNFKAKFLPPITEFVEYLTAKGIPALESFLDKASRALGAGSIDKRERQKELADELRQNKSDALKVLNGDILISDGDPAEAVSDYAKQRKALLEELKKVDLEVEEIAKLEAKLAGSDGKINSVFGKMESGHASASKAAKDHEKELQKLSDTMDKISGQTIQAFYDAMGVKLVSSTKQAEEVFLAATAAVGGFSVGLKNGITDYGKASQEITKISDSMAVAFGGKNAAIGTGQSLRTLTPDQATKGMTDFMGVGRMLRGEGEKPSKTEVETRAREVIEQPLSKVFNDAMVKGLEGGDFFKALGDGIKRTAIEALSNSITGSLFGSSGSISGIISKGSGGGGGILGGLGDMLGLGSNRAIGPDDVAVQGLNLASMGTSLALSYGISRLTGEGGLFGSSVQHGTEAMSSSSSINEQIKTARDAQTALQSTVGLSKETIQTLQDFRFSETSVAKHSSGDGIFSKKTDTYELIGGVAATQSLENFKTLSGKIAEEVLNRQYDIMMQSFTQPNAALDMQISDLTDAYTRGGSKDISLKTQIAQLTQQKKGNNKNEADSYFAFMMANPLIWDENANTRSPYKSDFGDLALSTRNYGSSMYGIDNPSNSAMIKLMKQEGGAERELSAQQASGKSFSELTVGGVSYKEILKRNIESTQKMMDDAAAAASGVGTYGNIEAQTAALERYKSLSTKFWADKDSFATLEKEEIDNAAAKLEAAKQAGLSFQDQWLSLATSNVSALTNSGDRNLLSSGISGGIGEDIMGQLSVSRDAGIFDFAQRQSEIAAKNDPAAMARVMADKVTALQSEAGFFQGIMDTAWSAAENAANDMDTRRAAADRYLKAQNAYYSAKMSALEAESQQQDEIKAQQEANKAKSAQTMTDLMGTLLTRIGESREVNGQSMVALLPGQPGFDSIVGKFKEAATGAGNQEAITAIDAISEYRRKYGWDR